MTKNVSSSGRTKHLDVCRYHYAREFVKEGFIKIIFVKSEDNLADGFTKTCVVLYTTLTSQSS
jgi:hypothetical protein